MQTREQPRTLDGRLQKVIRQVHVNLPWRLLDRYRPLVLEYRASLELGFSGAELDAADLRDVEREVKKLKSAGVRLTLHGPFWELCPGSQDPLIRQVTRLRLHQFLDVAAVVEPERLVCHTGFDPRHHRSHRREWVDRALKIWEPVVRRAESLGAVFCLENVWEEDPSLHRDILDRLPSPFFRFCLDVGHQHAFSRTSLPLWFEALEDKMAEVHLHDNDGSADDHLPVGQGAVNFHWLFRKLAQMPERPGLTVEPHTRAHLWETLEGLSPFLSSVEAAQGG